MNSWKVILATMVIFGTGVVTGGLLVHHADRGRDRRPARTAAGVRTSQPLSPGLMRIELLRRMERELDLSPEQHDPIDRVLREGQERMKKVMETVEPRRREEYRRTVEEFRKILTPEQRKRLDQLIKKQQRGHDQRKSAPARDALPGAPLPGTTAPVTNS